MKLATSEGLLIVENGLKGMVHHGEGRGYRLRDVPKLISKTLLLRISPMGHFFQMYRGRKDTSETRISKTFPPLDGGTTRTGVTENLQGTGNQPSNETFPDCDTSVHPNHT